MTRYISYILILLLSQIKLYAQTEIPSKVFHLDISNAQGARGAQFFDVINYIPLESTPQSLINRIDRVLVTDKYYIILDDFGNQVLLFDKLGKYHCKIDRIPGVEKPFARGILFNSVAVDRVKNQVVVNTEYEMVGGRGKMFFFNFDGKLIKTIPGHGGLTDFCQIGNKLLFKNEIARSQRETIDNPNPFNLLVFSNELKIHQKLLPFEPTSYLPESKGLYGGGSSLSQSGNKSPNVYFSPAPIQEYSIYKIDPTGITQKYSFIFPLGYTLPSDFVSNDTYSSDLFRKVNTSIVFGLDNIYGLNNWLSFKVKTTADINDKTFFYNKSTGTLLSAFRIQPDSKNKFLPLGLNSLYPIIGSDDEYFYSTESPASMFYARSQRKSLSHSAVLSNYFKSSAKKANPILIQFRPVQNL